MKELEELTADIREKLPRLITKKTHILADGEKLEYGIGKAPMLNDVLEWLSKKTWIFTLIYPDHSGKMET